jgi:hypothetical protein
VLVPRGLILLVSLTNGGTALARLLEAFLGLVFSIRPSIVGGCRPISLQEFLPQSEWLVHYQSKITRFAVASEVIVAERLETYAN